MRQHCCRSIAMNLRRRVKVNFRLVQRPLSCTTNQEHDFGFNGLTVESALCSCILVAPHVHHGALVVMPPSVAAVPVTAIR